MILIDSVFRDGKHFYPRVILEVRQYVVKEKKTPDLYHWRHKILIWESFKGALSGLRQFLAPESPFKMMENGFYFTSKAPSVLKIFKSLSWLFGHVSKRLDEKDKLNFKSYDVTAWLTNNCNIHIAQYLEK